MTILNVAASTVESWYEQTVSLDGTDFVLRLMWSERARRWYLDIETIDGTVLRSGIKVVADRDLVSRLSDDLRPLGQLWCSDQTGGGIDPDIRDLGSRCQLWYIEEGTLD